MKITKWDLQQIKHEAMENFKRKAVQDLDSHEFVTDCYIDAVLSFLHRNDVTVDLERDYKKTHTIKG